MFAVLFYLFIIVGFINVAHMGAYLVFGNLYDIKIHKLSRLAKKRRRYRNPLISILIPAYNEEATIWRCLDSIRKSTYKNVEVIVNNDASIDATAKKIQAFVKKFPKLTIRPINHRIRSGKAIGLNYAAKRYARGDLVMTLDADSLLQKNALKNVVKYFDEPAVTGVAANVRIIEDLGILGILQKFEHMVSYRSKKFYSLINCELIVGGVASTYRKDALKNLGYYDCDTVTEDIGLSMKVAASGNKAHKLVYAPDVIALTEGAGDIRSLLRQRYRWKLGNLQNLVKFRRLLFATASKYSKWLTFYRMPMAFLGELVLLLEPIILVYVLYLSIRYLSPSLLVGAYVAITIYFLLVIWPDEHMKLAEKFVSSIYAPFIYFIFYIMNAVQIISAARCIFNAKKIVSVEETPAVWSSPARAKEQVT